MKISRPSWVPVATTELSWNAMALAWGWSSLPRRTVPVGNESGHVGTFLMEHPHFSSVAHCIIDENVHRHRPPSTFGRFVPVLVMAASRARELGRYGCSLEFAVNDEYPEMRTYLEKTTGAAQYVYRVDLRAEMSPSPHNRVVLSAERDRTGLHQPVAHCVLDAEDFLNAELTLRELGSTLIRENRGRLRIDRKRVRLPARRGDRH